MTVSSISAFIPSICPSQGCVPVANRHNTFIQSSHVSEEFSSMLSVESERNEVVTHQTAESILNEPVTTIDQRNVKKKASTSAHKDGIFSPAVRAAKVVLGEERLNKVRAKAISKHSEVISGFVDTYESAFGTSVLKQLFKLADNDQNGSISKDELQTALTSLGFDWLKEKQITGIFARADADGNGKITLDEWISEAPKTLRTNLVKLAKKNGGDLGFLS
jgi:EF-hand domain pair